MGTDNSQNVIHGDGVIKGGNVNKSVVNNYGNIPASGTQLTLSPGLLAALPDSDQAFLTQNFLPVFIALQNLATNGGEDHPNLQGALNALSSELEATKPKSSRIKQFWQMVRKEADTLQGLNSAADLISKASLGIGLILAAI